MLTDERDQRPVHLLSGAVHPPAAHVWMHSVMYVNAAKNIMQYKSGTDSSDSSDSSDNAKEELITSSTSLHL